jgi:Ni,Fe-hydrogenase III small subunit/formate hydrogenlyase subunit 6/NADH:ubiquinone oxidoreductase subunit I
MYRGRPQCDARKCQAGCTACIDACPTGALGKKSDALSPRGEGVPPLLPSTPVRKKQGQDALATEAHRGQDARDADDTLTIDLGRCLFCTDCTDACPTGAIEFTSEHRMATRTRDALVVRSVPVRAYPETSDGAPANESRYALAQALDGEARRLFGRSLKLRQVSAGGCNACEADTNVLGTIVFDLGRFGIQFVASPRHADGLLITGPVPQNMALALKKTYEATAEPKLVIAVGACAISGGVSADNPEAGQGADPIVPVDLYIPGCPPHPITILDGLLRLLGRLPTP